MTTKKKNCVSEQNTTNVFAVKAWGQLILSAIVLILSLSIVFTCDSSSVGCSGGSSNDVTGTYRADLTLAQSGIMTTITLNSDGSAVIQQDGYRPQYTYWDYAGKGNDVRINDDGYWWFIDFDQNRIYSGAQDYCSNQRGYIIRKSY